VQDFDVHGVLPSHLHRLEQLGDLSLTAVLHRLRDDSERLRMVARQPHEPADLSREDRQQFVLGRRAGVHRHGASHQRRALGGEGQHVRAAPRDSRDSDGVNAKMLGDRLGVRNDVQEGPAGLRR
jgi:hypothetical protein